MRTLVLGLGNPILGDDSVGLRVAQRLEPALSVMPDIEVAQDYWGGLRLMERMIGYDRVLIIDAICTGAAPGTIQILSPDDIPTRRSASAHDVNLPTALELGRTSGASLPSDDCILLVAIEATEVLSFGQDLSPEVESAIPEAVCIVRKQLTDWRECHDLT